MNMNMERYIAIGIFLLSFNCMIVQGQPSFIRTTTMTSDSSSIVTTEYVDGLGRTSQLVVTDATPTGEDLATLQEYDLNGRESNKWNAVPTVGDGAYCDAGSLKQTAMAFYSDQFPYSRITYDNSPLNRVARQYGAGANWQSNNKCVVTEYTTNGVANPCRRYVRWNDYEGFTYNGEWSDGELDVTITTDEDGNKEIDFRDLRGLLILHRSIDACHDNLQHDTYYIYDSYGNLVFVLPPMASALFSTPYIPYLTAQDEVANLCYCYEYDHRNLCVSNRMPGCEAVLMRYDKAHRPIFIQDGNLRSLSKWRFMLYDSFGRPTVEGLCAESTLQDVAKIKVTTHFGYSGNLFGYNSGGLDLSDVESLSANYYDFYTFMSNFADVSDSLQYRTMAGYSERYNDFGESSARGMLTGTSTRVLDTAGNGGVLVRAMYYDEHGNMIQSHESNAMGGFDHYYYQLSFTGKPLKVMHVHETADTALTDVFQYIYDNMERPLTTTVSRNGESAVILASNTYNGLGQLAEQSLGSHANGIVDYTYNVRWWTQSITSPHFSQTLYYEHPYADATPCYNGNVSAVEWNALDAMAAATPTTHSYRFAYDGLNRLTAAGYSAVGDYLSWNGNLVVHTPPGQDVCHDYSTTYQYDLNGNITSLTRKGVNYCVPSGEDMTVWAYGDIDDLSLLYDGNQLRKVTDQCSDLEYAGAMDFKDGANEAVEYTWDANGNMTSDLNKGITSITYNVLNLPERIEYEDNHIVQYTYAADGRKLRVKYLLNTLQTIVQPGINPGLHGSSGEAGLMGFLPPITPQPGPDSLEINPPQLLVTLSTLDYCGNHVYRNGALERTMNDYGYHSDSTYYYYIKDYQGNVRAVIDQNGVLKEINNYYPYGGLMGAASTGVQPNKYGGKELDRQNGLDWYDSQARMLDPMVGRTTTMDPLSEKYYSISPYAWCANNPINLIDDNGQAFKAAITAWKYIKKAYNIYTKTGKLTPRNLKQAGLSEIVDIAGDLYTVFDGNTSVEDKLWAGFDLIVGTDFNNKGKKEVVNIINKEKSKIKPNGGYAKPHGGKTHNERIDNLIEILKSDKDVTNIRKNQKQVDINGHVVGNNRPDVQFDKNGRHTNVEYDTRSAASVEHRKTVSTNDPNARNKFYRIK